MSHLIQAYFHEKKFELNTFLGVFTMATDEKKMKYYFQTAIFP
jgi:hypothetical protein